MAHNDERMLATNSSVIGADNGVELDMSWSNRLTTSRRTGRAINSGRPSITGARR